MNQTLIALLARVWTCLICLPVLSARRGFPVCSAFIPDSFVFRRKRTSKAETHAVAHSSAPMTAHSQAPKATTNAVQDNEAVDSKTERSPPSKAANEIMPEPVLQPARQEADPEDFPALPVAATGEADSGTSTPASQATSPNDKVKAARRALRARRRSSMARTTKEWLISHQFSPELDRVLFEAGIESPADLEFVVLADLQEIFDPDTAQRLWAAIKRATAHLDRLVGPESSPTALARGTPNSTPGSGTTPEWDMASRRKSAVL